MTTPTPMAITNSLSKQLNMKHLLVLFGGIVTLVVTSSLFIVFTLLDSNCEPKINGFFCDDKSIRYPYIHKATIPSWLLFLMAFVVPIFVFFCGTLLDIKKICNYKQNRSQKKKLLYYFLRLGVWFGWYLIGISLTSAITNIIKMSAGELRPYFLEACNPDMSIINCTDEYGWPLYVTNYTCRGHPSAVSKIIFSFWSCFTEFVHICLFSCKFDRQKYNVYELYISSLEIIHKRSPLQFLFTAITGILLTVLIGVTRIVDNRHHFRDVVAGSVLGTFMAFLVVYFNTSYYYFEDSVNEKNINQKTKSSHLLLINDTTDQQEEEEEENAIERNNDIA